MENKDDIKSHLKRWETNFFKNNNRYPSKDDVSNDKYISLLYNQYRKLKKDKPIDDVTGLRGRKRNKNKKKKRFNDENFKPLDNLIVKIEKDFNNDDSKIEKDFNNDDSKIEKDFNNDYSKIEKDFNNDDSKIEKDFNNDYSKIEKDSKKFKDQSKSNIINDKKRLYTDAFDFNENDDSINNSIRERNENNKKVKVWTSSTQNKKNSKKTQPANFVSLNLKGGYKGNKNIKKSKWKNKRFKKGNIITDIAFQDDIYQSSSDNNSEEGKEIETFFPNENNYLESKNFLVEKNDFIEIKNEKKMKKNEKNEKIIKNFDLNFVLKEIYGFSEFRKGQKESIENILNGISTLLILSTGAGKSLTYQLPTFLINQNSFYLTIVISPLLSLMEDQLLRLPKCISGAAFHSNLSYEKRKQILNKLENKEIQILYISPETLSSGQILRLALSGKLPPIKFACIDEAHCLSEWSHNFRPAFLKINKILKNVFNVNCILALTATATEDTAKSICERLNINKVIRGAPIPNNLKLSLSFEKDTGKQATLVSILKSPIYNNGEKIPIIIYCTKQRDTDNVASYLRRRGFNAESYHAGKNADQRSSIQFKFINNEIYIIVATIAFGMGIDKRNVRGVIHYNMPKSLENYVQEIGRAGRDGKNAHCHMFWNRNDLYSLRGYAYGDTAERSDVVKLIKKIFFNNNINEIEGKKFIALNPIRVSTELDMKQEVIETVLSSLELTYSYIEKIGDVYLNGIVRFLGGTIHEMKQTSPIVSSILKTGRWDGNEIKVNFIKASNISGLGSIKIYLQELECLRKSGNLAYELENKAWYYKINKNLKNDENDINILIEEIMNDMYKIEKLSIDKVNEIFSMAKNIKKIEISEIFYNNNLNILEMTNEIKENVKLYFANESKKKKIDLAEEITPSKMSILKEDVKAFLIEHGSVVKNARAIARIFQSINSTKYKAKDWAKHSYWGRHRDIDFHIIKNIAEKQLSLRKNKK